MLSACREWEWPHVHNGRIYYELQAQQRRQQPGWAACSQLVVEGCGAGKPCIHQLGQFVFFL